ncbi:hypothetical protein COOONC_23052 [Cooperia oncophora]
MEEDIPSYSHPTEAIYEECVETTENADAAIRLDPRDIRSIIDAIRTETLQPATPSAKPVFKREGYAKQFEFNSSILRKLIPLQSSTSHEIATTITQVIQDLNTRNETLVIADEHPEVFQFLDHKSKGRLPEGHGPSPERVHGIHQKERRGLWEALEPSVLVSTTIRYGYSIPFMSSPTRPKYDGNRKSALEHADFVTSEISDLLQSGVVREVPEPSIENLHVHPLSVAKDIRYTRGVAREIASAQNLEWPLRRRWAKTDEEKATHVQELPESIALTTAMHGSTDSFASRFRKGADLAREASDLGIPLVGKIIMKALQTDRAPNTIASYKAELRKFVAWKQDYRFHNIPLSKARNLYLAKGAYEGRSKTLPLVVAALNYFYGPQIGVDRDIQASLLEAEKRSAPPVTHRAKIDPQSLRKIINQGIGSQDPNITQAASLALLQFKAFLRIGEARCLKVQDLKRVSFLVIYCYYYGAAI